MKLFVAIVCVFFVLSSCQKDKVPGPVNPPDDHLRYFGFTLIDMYWDDPTDSLAKTNYADEVYRFCNIADMLVAHPNDTIVDRVRTFYDFQLTAVLHLHSLFFQLEDTNSPSGYNYSLRPDYQQRWHTFKNINRQVLTPAHIAAFYIGEEPTWNGISATEMALVGQLLKADFPLIPLLLIEAYPALDDLQIPEVIDWVGFDRYFIKNPNTHAGFLADWQKLQAKLTRPSQRIMLIMDSHYIDCVHGTLGNIELGEMGQVAHNYYELARSEQRVIGMLGYFWPNGFDFEEAIGARGMPIHVQKEYEQIGRQITKKTN